MPKAKNSSSKEKISISLNRDEEFRVKGNFQHVIGADEAGRGPLAGPVVAAACFIPENLQLIPGIKDSKLLNEEDREAAYDILMKTKEIIYDVSIISHDEIDRINILQASLLAMTNATKGVLEKIAAGKSKNKKDSKSKRKGESEESSDSEWQKDFLGLIDGPFTPGEYPIEAKPVIQGDRKIYSIAAASVIAKVTRDRIMAELHEQYPHYLFDKNKGYPTYEHRVLLMEHGPSPVHRRSYGPVKAAVAKFEPSNETGEEEPSTPKSAKKSKKVSRKKPTVAEDPAEVINATKNLASQLEEVAEPKKRGRKRKVDDVVAPTPKELPEIETKKDKPRKKSKKDGSVKVIQDELEDNKSVPRRRSPRFQS